MSSNVAFLLAFLFLRVARLDDNSWWDMLFFGLIGAGLAVYGAYTGFFE